jgi:hypothetical protein
MLPAQGPTRATLTTAGNILAGRRIGRKKCWGPIRRRSRADPAHRHAVRLTKFAAQDTNGDPLLDPALCTHRGNR